MKTYSTTSQLRVGLIGDPVAHSYSPRFQQAAFDALGIPARYELWQTPASELASRVASLRAADCLGANVTIPHKEAVLPLLDVVDPLAARTGAVNTIVHHDEYLYGYNTDAPALLRVLAEYGFGEQLEGGLALDDLAPARGATTFRAGEGLWKRFVSLRGHTAILLGAGGAARSAAFVLADASIERLVIVNRTLEPAWRLASAVQQSSDCEVFCLNDPENLMPYPRSIIINATPLGMRGAGEDASPLPAEMLARFDPETFVLDMVYNPTETTLLRQAHMLGMRAVNGLSMLLHQGALAFTLWTGQPAPLDVMRAAIL